jgi:hypothetical protein
VVALKNKTPDEIGIPKEFIDYTLVQTDFISTETTTSHTADSCDNASAKKGINNNGIGGDDDGNDSDQMLAPLGSIESDIVSSLGVSSSSYSPSPLDSYQPSSYPSSYSTSLSNSYLNGGGGGVTGLPSSSYSSSPGLPPPPSLIEPSVSDSSPNASPSSSPNPSSSDNFTFPSTSSMNINSHISSSSSSSNRLRNASHLSEISESSETSQSSSSSFTNKSVTISNFKTQSSSLTPSSRLLSRSMSDGGSSSSRTYKISLKNRKNYWRTSLLLSKLDGAVVPHEAMYWFMAAMRMLHKEAQLIAGNKPLDADTMFPILVYAAVQAGLPWIHQNLFFLRHFGLVAEAASEEGSTGESGVCVCERERYNQRDFCHF